MSVNKVDYEVLEQGVTVYANQATALQSVLDALASMNGSLQEGWTNQTSNAFIERYENEHKVALEKARDAIQSISEFISSYMRNRMDEDASGASFISGS